MNPFGWWQRRKKAKEIEKILNKFFAGLDARQAEMANRNRRKSDHKKSHKRGSRGHA